MLNFTRQNSILDIILSSKPEAINNLEICGPIGSSDHNYIVFLVEMSHVPNICKNKYRSYRTGKYLEFRENLNKTNWNDIFDGKNTEEVWQSFKAVLQKGVENYISLKTKKKSPPN